MTEAGGWRVRGHDYATSALHATLQHPSHGYLFLGPPHVGKRTLAFEFAKALNCEAEVGRRPCQACSSCRLILRRNHPDVLLIEPEEKAHILIEQIRAMRQEVAMLPSRDGWRVIVVEADVLTEPAADALLKTLEEPGERVVLVLTGSDERSIPETVVSRCRVVQLGLVSYVSIVDELAERGTQPDDARELAALAYGAIGWAIRAAGAPEMAERRRAIREDVRRWSGGTLLDRLALAEAVSAYGGKPDRVRSMVLDELEVMAAWWRDVLLAASGRGDLVLSLNDQEEVAVVAQGETPATALCALRAISTAATRITQNVEPRLTLEALAASG